MIWTDWTDPTTEMPIIRASWRDVAGYPVDLRIGSPELARLVIEAIETYESECAISLASQERTGEAGHSHTVTCD